jgi:transmembrane sensor
MELEENWNKVYRWIEESPAHGVAFAKAEASWEITHGVRPIPNPHDIGAIMHNDPDVDELHHGQHLSGLGERRFSRRTFGAIAAGSGLAIAASASWALWRTTGPERYGTGIGEERLVQLADGSKVQINTDSVIDVSLHRGRRAIHLLKGEVRFDLAPDPARPFLVTARDGAMQGAGTAFNLRLKQDLTELTVIDGQVELLDDGAAGATVPAGSGATIRTTAITITPLTQRDLALRTAWQQGNIRLDRETLEQAVAEFNRYREQPMIIGDPGLARLQMGGVFSARHSDDFIEALKETFGVRAVPGENGAVILLPDRRSIRS